MAKREEPSDTAGASEGSDFLRASHLATYLTSRTANPDTSAAATPRPATRLSIWSPAARRRAIFGLRSRLMLEACAHRVGLVVGRGPLHVGRVATELVHQHHELLQRGQGFARVHPGRLGGGNRLRQRAADARWLPEGSAPGPSTPSSPPRSSSCLTYFSTAMWIRDSYSALLSTPYLRNRSPFFLRAQDVERRHRVLAGSAARGCSASACHSSE